ncbi:sugar-binding transcriptional regulator [Nonomuraea sp. NEAU-A123]|uniref:sugar-binding transcriptional regulator n=1 Tax=Nonomuraea sp. NEAU-A123 TaxID=2839649 RepID=UPI001BE42FC7|nr:sugar-binding transcriptional regulator [Nonomuraea sp. NEAU-A123]MBT2227925.1 sugar-binding transcriptional regulator [Nonomuraea sp. NEAU-A123]
MNYEDQLYQVAIRYYESGETQEQIAQRMHLTRWKVGRMLAEARQAGIVRIEVLHPRSRVHLLERSLKERFGLRDAIVVAAGSTNDPEQLRDRVAAAGADHLIALRPAPRLIGVSWGRTLDRLAGELTPGWARGVNVVQINGALSRSRRPTTAHSMASLIAHHGGGTATLLPAPAILEQERTRAVLESDRAVSDVLDLATRADVFLFSPGGMSSDSVLVDSGQIDADDIARLARAGAVGDVLGRFIDAEGRIVDPGLDGRTLGLSLDVLRAAPTSIALVSGEAKHAVCRAAVLSRVCNVLITDDQSATYLLDTATMEAV